MKKSISFFAVVFFALFASSSALARVIDLQVGESTQLGSTTVRCGQATGGGSCNVYGCSSCGTCNVYGCPQCKSGYSGGSCNVYGCWDGANGTCNVYGCSHNASCNVYGCSDNGTCNVYGCP